MQSVRLPYHKPMIMQLEHRTDVVVTMGTGCKGGLSGSGPTVSTCLQQTGFPQGSCQQFGS
ncbi:MAG: hypothetical protein M3081_21750 [Gemmatimonadota bacterium]|nr:hypothetical protein [Gemmatimonadota bacterium]